MFVNHFELRPSCRDRKIEFNATQTLTYLNARGTICAGANCNDGISAVTSTQCWTDGYEINAGGTVLTPVTWSTPQADTADWYDPEFPESAEFLGFWLQDVSGLDSTLSRDVRPRVVGVGGGSLGPLRPQQRTMTFKLLAFGCSEAALEYAMRWLIDMLSGECDACSGCNAWVRVACPDSTTETPLGVGETLIERWKTYRWQLKGVGLVNGPTWATAPIEDMACRVRSIEFTLAASDPYLYQDAVECTGATTWVPEGLPPCLPICDWLEDIVGHSYQVCCYVDSTRLIGETIINLTINTGSNPISQLDFTGKTLASGTDCDTSGTTFYTLKLQNLPANAVIAVDTAAQRVTITQGGVTADAFYLVNVDDGDQTFGFPSLRAAAACYCAIVNACSVANDATATITTQYRVL